jgi:hypothetical protein
MKRETCAICFQDYLLKNTKDHQCPETFCGACGEQYDPATEQDENGFHLSEICGANDEIKEYEGGCMDCTFVTDNRNELINHSCNEKGE